jgi:ubiquitin C-terminal hydrolase
MDLSQYKNRGYTGLTNLGNTCFLNSCMQVINHTYEFNEFLNSKKYEKHTKKDIPESIIIDEWNDLRTIMWTNNGIVSPNRFVYNVQQLAQKKGRELFTGWAQNDLPEFLLFMIECMHNCISRAITMKIMGNPENSMDLLATECYKMLQDTYSKDYSEMMELFYGIYVSELSSVDGEIRHAIKPEQYFILDLEIPKNGDKNLYDCLDAFTQYEIMEGDNAWFNEKTGEKETVKKRITFWNFPTILVMTLKRFSADGQDKIQDLIDYPLDQLDLSRYVSGYNPRQYVYELYGVCNHSGGPTGGHYTAFVKNADNEWIHYDDTRVQRGISVKHIVSPGAYCLFYRKKNSLV